MGRMGQILQAGKVLMQCDAVLKVLTGQVLVYSSKESPDTARVVCACLVVPDVGSSHGPLGKERRRDQAPHAAQTSVYQISFHEHDGRVRLTLRTKSFFDRLLDIGQLGRRLYPAIRPAASECVMLCNAICDVICAQSTDSRNGLSSGLVTW